MEALLIDEWLRGSAGIGLARETGAPSPADAPVVELIRDDGSLAVVRERIRAIGAAHAVPSEVVDRACLVMSEIARNHLRHAVGGRVVVRPITRVTTTAASRPEEHRGIEVIGVDRGKGIRDVTAALDTVAARTHGSLGVGIGSIRRLSTDVDFDIRLEEGTRIVARVFDREAPRIREVGIYGRPIDGEEMSGDHASFVRLASSSEPSRRDDLHVVICDGLGHGWPAREAASAAIRVFDERLHAGQPNATDYVLAAHAALHDTRGAVLATAEINERTDALQTLSVGNIDLQVVAPRSARRIGGSSAMVGGRGGPTPKARIEATPLVDGDVLVMTTDGIQSRMSIETELMLLRAHPIVIAQRILEQWSRDSDDALVVVVR